MKSLIILLASTISFTAFAQHMPTYAKKVDTPRRGVMINRYQYVGSAPRFEAKDLEVVASKMMLTIRVKGWVTASMLSDYRKMMLKRWERINTNLETTSMELIGLRNPLEVIEDVSNPAQKNWATMAAAYMTNVLESTGIQIYNNSSSTDISTAILRYLLQDPSLSIDDGYRLLNEPSDEMASRILFSKQLNSQFTPDNSRPGYTGYLTFVFPIADHIAGPFAEPETGKYKIGAGFSKELYHKQWSATLNEKGNPLGDVFGGFPFLMYIPGRDPKYSEYCDPATGICEKYVVAEGHKGIAFHGPVDDQTNIGAVYNDSNGLYTGAWYLQRGHVSHGCNRMDGNDVMELSALLPDLSVKQNKVPITILDTPDVYFDPTEGRLVVADVNYYGLPTSRKVTASDTLDKVRTNWFKNVLVKSIDRGGPGFSTRFDLQSMTFTGLPVPPEESAKVSTPSYEVPLKTFPTRGVRLIEYKNGPSPIMQFLQ